MSSNLMKLDVCPDTEGILSVKQNLKDAECEDYVLLSNLDFCEQVFRHSPLCKDITLKVIGEWQYVKIGKAEDIIYTVTSTDGQTHIDCCVYCPGDFVTCSDIKNIHFSVHSCQNEKRNCFTEAEEATKSELRAFKIICHTFSITYMPRGVPEQIKTIRTKCQLKLDDISAEGLLEKKCWIEKEKANCRELKACIEYLIEKYLTAPRAHYMNNCKFLLQGDKQIVEISSNIHHKQYVLMYTENSEVSMFPPSLK